MPTKSIHQSRSNDEPARRGLPVSHCRDGYCGPDAEAPKVGERAVAGESPGQGKGLAWLVGGFVFCPCHLPITLWILGGVLAGTGAGVYVRENPVIVAAITTLIWLAATWRGIRMMR
jgi:hypothetical protein